MAVAGHDAPRVRRVRRVPVVTGAAPDRAVRRLLALLVPLRLLACTFSPIPHLLCRRLCRGAKRFVSRLEVVARTSSTRHHRRLGVRAQVVPTAACDITVCVRPRAAPVVRAVRRGVNRRTRRRWHTRHVDELSRRAGRWVDADHDCFAVRHLSPRSLPGWRLEGWGAARRSIGALRP